MKTFENLKTTIIPLLSNYQTGFLISGGLDSSLLLYASLLIMQDNCIKFSPKIFTVPRHDDSVRHAKNIIDFLNQQFNYDLSIIKVGDPNLHHTKQVLSGIKSSMQLVDYLLLGDTKNPDHLDNGPIRVKSYNNKILQPFFDLTKRDTVSLAIYLNCLELMKISHTCTESVEIRCEKCWQCKERKWGFLQNNFMDPGNK
jgi:7-cyano-7-deazaguanine synthase in queuosine biosynthesis